MRVAPTIVLQHEPAQASARAILDSLLAETSGGAHPGHEIVAIYSIDLVEVADESEMSRDA